MALGRSMGPTLLPLIFHSPPPPLAVGAERAQWTENDAGPWLGGGGGGDTPVWVRTCRAALHREHAQPCRTSHLRFSSALMESSVLILVPTSRKIEFITQENENQSPNVKPRLTALF